jgi:hypothetical protein
MNDFMEHLPNRQDSAGKADGKDRSGVIVITGRQLSVKPVAEQGNFGLKADWQRKAKNGGEEGREKTPSDHVIPGLHGVINAYKSLAGQWVCAGRLFYK